MRVSLLYTESAGDGVSRENLREALERSGRELVHMVEHDGDLEEAVNDQSTELLVAAGGDGTVRRAANALVGRRIPLAILPLGTANNIATSLGIDGSIAQLIARWDSARRRPLDLGVVRGSWGESRFLEAVGVGLIPAGIATMDAEPDQPHEDSDSELARAVRRYRDVLSRLQPRRWTLSLDGAQLDEELLLVEVLNIRSVGPNFVLSPAADPSDGFFSVVAAGEEHREELAGYLQRRINGENCRLSLPTRRARRIEIQGWEQLHVDDEIHRSPSVGAVSIDIEIAAVQLLIS
jgi:diacylglycerol kinase (ATP)